MKTFITALSLCVVPALASPACVSGTYASYEALSGGCSIGDATFSNFSNLSFVNSPGVPVLPASEIIVSPSGSPTDASLIFQYVDANANPSPVTLNQLGQIFSFGFSFQVVASPSTLTGIQMDSTFGNTSPGSAAATKNAQLVGGGPTFTSTVNDGGTSNSLGTYSGPVVSLSGIGAFLITDTTSLQAQSGAVTQSGFENSFILAPGSVSPTPEGRSIAMIGFGLLSIGLVRRYNRGKKLREAH